MSNGVVPPRFRRIGVASIILVLVLLVSPMLGVSARSGIPFLQAPIQSVSGAVLGTATFTPMPAGGVMIQISVRGFNPVAGSHRVAISSLGRCLSPYTPCAAFEVLVLPDMQFNGDGSGDYMTISTAVTLDWFRQPWGTSILIHADTKATSDVIGYGMISPGSQPGPGPFPRPRPHPQPRPQPQPQPAVGHYRVVAALGLRLRAGPGLGYATRLIVPAGTVVESLGAEQWNGGILWAKVRAGGRILWAAKTYLRAV